MKVSRLHLLDLSSKDSIFYGVRICIPGDTVVDSIPGLVFCSLKGFWLLLIPQLPWRVYSVLLGSAHGMQRKMTLILGISSVVDCLTTDDDSVEDF